MMAITAHDLKRAAGTFYNRSQLESALERLRDSDFDMNDVSVLAKYEEGEPGSVAGVPVTDTVGNQSEEKAVRGATTGGIIGGIAGLLVGIGALAIPGIGPIMTAGVIGTTLATTLTGSAIGAATGGLVGGLIGLGIPEARAENYDAAIRKGGYLVLVDGTDTELQKAHAILQGGNIDDFGIYDIPAHPQSDTSTPHADDHEPNLGDRARNLGQTIEGQTQKTWGNVTGNPDDQVEGELKTQQANEERRTY